MKLFNTTFLAMAFGATSIVAVAIENPTTAAVANRDFVKQVRGCPGVSMASITNRDVVEVGIDQFDTPIADIAGEYGVQISGIGGDNELPTKVGINTMVETKEIFATDDTFDHDIRSSTWAQLRRRPIEEFQAMATNHSIETRNEPPVYPPHTLFCCPNVPTSHWGSAGGATSGRILEGIDYLRTLYNHRAICNVGPRSCVRVSCSYDSSIWLCNEEHFAIEPTCNTIADYAQELANTCRTGWMWSGTICGQVWDKLTGTVSINVLRNRC